MEFTKKVRNLKRKLPALKHRLAEQGRRLCAVVICASLVIGGFPGAFFQAFAADESGEYVFEFDKASLQDALNAAVGNGTTLDADLLFLGDNAGEYAELFNPDGTLYELKDLEPNEDAERDKDIGLRAFVRLEGDINIDESYEIDGSEEVLFLFTNKTDISNYVQIVLEDAETEWIEVPAAKDIPVEMPDDLAITLSPVGGAGAGSAGTGGDIVIEGISSDEDNDSDIYEDSEVSIEDAEEDAEAAEDEAASEDDADEGREKSSVSDDAGESDNSHDEAGSSNDGDSADKADSGKDDAGDSSSEKGSSSGNDSSSDKDSSSDNSSSGDKDSSSDKDSSDDKDSSSTERPSRHRGATNGRGSSHDKESNGEKSASISANKTQLLAASLTLASSSDAEKADDASPSDASPSDASRVIDGTVYDPVRLGRWGAVAFGTTTADLGLDESDKIFSVVYEGDDYTITVEYDSKAALPEDVILTGEEYDKDSDTFFERYEEAREFYGWEEGKEPAARLFDVTLWSGEEEIEPAAPVDVTFTFFSDDEDEYGITLLSADVEDDEDEYADDAEEDDETGYKGLKYTITHFGAEETETVDSEVISEAGEQSVSFTLESFSDIMVLAYEGDGKGKVVLNLGNGNGKYNFADYAGNKNAGTDLRYTVSDDLAPYAYDDGIMYITLPTDEDLGKAFTIVTAETGSDLPDITLNLEREKSSYDYKLVGWVNVANGDYYDVSKENKTAVINLADDNVFYADWIAASYDYGKSTDKNLRTDTVSTSAFVTMHMYDYNELYNLYSESMEQKRDDDETLWEAWTDSGKLYNVPMGANLYPEDEAHMLTDSFIFVNDGTTAKSIDQGTQENTGGMLSWPNNKTDGNTWTGSGQPPLDATTTWGITSPESAPIDMLYNQSQDVLGVHYVGEADYLFWLDKNNYYTYNSKESAATYNQSDGRFYVYDESLFVKNTSFSCFLPFNDFVADTTNKNSPYDATDGSVNYWFGMDMEVKFYLPDATGVGGNLGDNGEDMIFNFSGDDDIFIFIDDKLVLDMSGIHDESFGSIDFTKGTVTMGMDTNDAGDIVGTTKAPLKVSDLKLKAGSHTLKVYYMERGGYASNLEIQFNVAPLWKYETGDVKTVIAEKVWEDSLGNPIESDNLPETYKTKGVEVGLFDILGEAGDGVTGYTNDDDVYTFGYTDDKGIHYKFVYNNTDPEKPSLTYTVDGKETLYTKVNSDGKVLDDNDLIVAWLEGDKLYIRMDIQTLNSDNNWQYVWELLDPDGEYEAIELTESDNYTTKESSKDLIQYLYWSVIGDEEIEANLSDPDFAVILTEAAQEATETLGDTKEAYGYVLVGDTDGSVTTQTVKFSQRSTLKTIENPDGSIIFLGTYGVTSQSEIESLGNEEGNGAVWYFIDTGHEDDDVNGTVEGFNLYSKIAGNYYYLAVDNNNDEASLIVTPDKDSASEFYYDSLGELMIFVGDEYSHRVEILPDGTISIGVGETEAAEDDVRIYALIETDTSGFMYTAVNTFLPEITLKKVDADTDEPLSGVSFTLQDDESGLYYGGVDENDDVIWSGSEVLLYTDSDGEITLHYLPDGTYTLTEAVAPDGYIKLPSSIKIIINNGLLSEALWSDDNLGDKYDSLLEVTGDGGFVITIRNQAGGPELPKAGGPGTMPFRIAGLLISGSAVWLYITLRRRRRWIEN